jgi:hypothetical protein
MESPNAESFASYLLKNETPPPELIHLLRGFTGYAEAFRSASDKLAKTATYHG